MILPSYKVVASSGNTSQDVTMQLGALGWEEGTQDISMRAMVTADLPPGDTQLHYLLRIGAYVQVFVDDQEGNGFEERFRGRVEDWEYQDEEQRAVMITAYDLLSNIAHSNDDLRYPNEVTNRDIIDDICQRYSIPQGRITIPTVPFRNEQYFRGKNLALVFKEVLQKTRVNLGGSGTDYFIRGSLDGDRTLLEILKPGGNTRQVTLDGLSVIGMRDKWSIADLITEIIMVGVDPDPALLGSTAIPNQRVGTFHTDHFAEFGIRREVLYGESFGNDEQLMQQAVAQLFAERGEPSRIQTVRCPDISWIRKGDIHTMQVGTLNGPVVVTGVHHDATTGTCTLEIDTSGFLGRYVPLAPLPSGFGPQGPLLPDAPGALPTAPVAP